jgi:adenylate kinase family enzyme
MERIMIIGCCGSGKSTFAEKLQKRTNIPLIHLDKLYWLPNWTEPKVEDWEKIVTIESEKKSWIIDGNYGGTMEIRLRKADTIIFLDRSRWLCTYRILKRTIQDYGRTRKDMAAACVERFDWEFLVYTFRFNTVKRPKLLKRITNFRASKSIIILKNEQEIEAFLKVINITKSH